MADYSTDGPSQTRAQWCLKPTQLLTNRIIPWATSCPTNMRPSEWRNGDADRDGRLEAALQPNLSIEEGRLAVIEGWIPGLS